MGATIIEAPSLTKNKAGKRDLEVHQSKERNAWHFGMTAVNEHDLNQAQHLLHGEEAFVFADSGYR